MRSHRSGGFLKQSKLYCYVWIKRRSVAWSVVTGGAANTIIPPRNILASFFMESWICIVPPKCSGALRRTRGHIWLWSRLQIKTLQTVLPTCQAFVKVQNHRRSQGDEVGISSISWNRNHTPNLFWPVRFTESWPFPDSLQWFDVQLGNLMWNSAVHATIVQGGRWLDKYNVLGRGIRELPKVAHGKVVRCVWAPGPNSNHVHWHSRTITPGKCMGRAQNMRSSRLSAQMNAQMDTFPTFQF